MQKRGNHHLGHREALSSSHTSSQEHYHHHTHKLLYFITTLLIILILAIIISYPLYNQPIIPSLPAETSLTIDSVTCTWKDTFYETCMSVRWSGEEGFYVKPYIPGGTPSENVEKYYTQQFFYCQPVGAEGGYRVSRAFLYRDQELLRDVGKGVSCQDKTVSPPPLPVKKAYSYSQNGQFLATIAPANARSASQWYQTLNKTVSQQSTRLGRAAAEGFYTLTFPDSVQSCTFSGNWITDNDPFLRQRRYCHDATGTFTSSADTTQQFVVNDPDYFTWAGPAKPSVNPVAQRYSDHVVFMNTCDNNYYRAPTYYVRAQAEGFGSKQLTINWEYYDEETQPQVFFSFNATCVLQP